MVSSTTSTSAGAVIGVFEWPGGRGWEVDVGGVGSGGWGEGGTYLVSSTTSTSAGAVIGVFEWPPVGSSPASSPLVELTTCAERPQCVTRNAAAVGHITKRWSHDH